MKRLLALFVSAACAMCAMYASPAAAIEYLTVDAAAPLYDAPSQRGVKRFVIKRDTPVELVVSLEGWAKVRDAEGTMAWIERKFLAERRSVIVTAERAQVRQKAEESAPLEFEAEKGVVLEYLEPAPGGWVKVHHRDGQSGFVRANQIWGS
jgi:SH3-like domain-containing protein